MLKRFMGIFLTVAICCISLLAGCSNSATASTSKGAPTELVYYTIGTAGSDLSKVMTEVNKMTKAKINCTVKMNYIDYGDYDSKMTAIINSGENYDIAFTTENDNYLQNVKKGAFAALDDLLDKDGSGIKSQMDSRFWTGVKVDGKIYAVPTDKEIATPYYFVYNKALVEKYKMDISKIDTVQQLEPLFKTIKQNEKDWTPYMLGQGFVIPIGYAFIISNTIPVCIDEHDSSGKILNFYDQQKTVDTINTMRKYFQAGYINKDAATATFSSDAKSFFKMDLAGPDADASFTMGATYPKVTHLVENPPIVTTYSAQGAMVAINSASKHKDEAMKFINLCHTDVDVCNTLYYGVKGVHWKLDSNNQVAAIEPAAKNYAPPTYTLGSNILATPITGCPTTWAEDYKTFNKAASSSVILGFEPDTSSISSEIASITNATSKYQSQLFTGSVDPSVYLPKMKAELKQAGIDKVITELQTQLDAFKASQK